MNIALKLPTVPEMQSESSRIMAQMRGQTILHIQHATGSYVSIGGIMCSSTNKWLKSVN